MVVSLPVGLTQQTLVGVGDPIGSTHRLIVAWAHSVFVTSTLRRYMLKMFKNCVKSAYNTQLSSEIQGFKKILLLHLYNLYNINIISNTVIILPCCGSALPNPLHLIKNITYKLCDVVGVFTAAHIQYTSSNC